MNRSVWIFITIILFVIAGCDPEHELTKSIFIPDPHNPELPLYTEWGYNTFGAYYERAAFTSNDGDVPAKFIVQNGSTLFILEGDKTAGQYQHIRLDFILPTINPETYADLVALHQTLFDLTDITVFITIDDQTFPAEIIEGNLQFVRAQHLIVDKKPMEVILSGVFNLKFMVDEIPITISEGRFDVGINNDNFFEL
jgi:hypothetical protein